MSSHAQIGPQGAEKQLSKVNVGGGGGGGWVVGGGWWVYRAKTNTALVQLLDGGLPELVN